MANLRLPNWIPQYEELGWAYGVEKGSNRKNAYTPSPHSKVICNRQTTISIGQLTKQ